MGQRPTSIVNPNGLVSRLGLVSTRYYKKLENIPIDANPRLSGRDATARTALQVYRSVVKATIAGSGYDNIQFSPIGA